MGREEEERPPGQAAKRASSVLVKHVFSSHNTTSPSHCSALSAHMERDICSEMSTVESKRSETLTFS